MSNIYRIISETNSESLSSSAILERIKKALKNAEKTGQHLNYYECVRCRNSWYDVYDCDVDMEGSLLGRSILMRQYM